MCVSAGDMVEFRSKTERGKSPDGDRDWPRDNHVPYSGADPATSESESPCPFAFRAMANLTNEE